METLKDTYLGASHREASKKASAIIASQSPKSSNRFTEQAKSLASQNRNPEGSAKTSTEPYVPSKNKSSEVA